MEWAGNREIGLGQSYPESSTKLGTRSKMWARSWRAGRAQRANFTHRAGPSQTDWATSRGQNRKRSTKDTGSPGWELVHGPEHGAGRKTRNDFCLPLMNQKASENLTNMGIKWLVRIFINVYGTTRKHSGEMTKAGWSVLRTAEHTSTLTAVQHSFTIGNA